MSSGFPQYGVPVRQKVAILISPAPVDGYPPVQHQARLLAQTGFAVELITVPREVGSTVTFANDAVSITELQLRPGRGLQTATRLLDLFTAVSKLRKRHRKQTVVEISYDPLAHLISDFAPFRPRYRVAHFHESLDPVERTWANKRLIDTIGAYQAVVVADSARAEELQAQLKLSKLPAVVPNYPLQLEGHLSPISAVKSDGFELIYAGSIGRDQQLDLVAKSLLHCPEHVYLSLLGSANRPSAIELKDFVAQLGLSHRVRFEGWVNYAEVPQRLARAHLGVSFYSAAHANTRNSAGASNKRYEYMRAGLPQVSDSNPGVPELIEGNGIGRCLTTSDPVELARIITDYTSDPSRGAEEGRRAFELHQTRYNYKAAFKPIISSMLEFADGTVSVPSPDFGPDMSL